MRLNTILSALLIIILLTLVGTTAVYTAKNAEKPTYMQTVVIDAGHGGIDGGAVGKQTGVTEAALNLAIARQVKAQLNANGVGVVMTREDENSLADANATYFKREDMLLRREIILNTAPALVVSIHINKFPQTSRRGAQVFREKTEPSMALANSVQQMLNANVNTPYCGREFAALYGDYYMLKCSEYPTVIVECGFISNPQEELLLQQTDYQQLLAYSIAGGIIAYLYANTALSTMDSRP